LSIQDSTVCLQASPLYFCELEWFLNHEINKVQIRAIHQLCKLLHQARGSYLEEKQVQKFQVNFPGKQEE
jgi:hypothetical protein